MCFNPIKNDSFPKVLNGTEIMKTERYGAELDYMKKFGLDWIKVQKEEDSQQKRGLQKQFIHLHPR